MTLTAAGCPDNEDAREEYTFTLVAVSGGFHLRLVKFTRSTREDELDNWTETGAFMYPDISNKSTLPPPVVPQWAVTDAKAQLLQHITLENE